MSFEGRMWCSLIRDKGMHVEEYECLMLDRWTTWQRHQFVGDDGGNFGCIAYSIDNDIYIPKWGGWKFQDIFREDIVDVLKELKSSFISEYDTDVGSDSYHGFVTGFDLNKPMGYQSGKWYYPAIGVTARTRSHRTFNIVLSTLEEYLTTFNSNGSLRFTFDTRLPYINSSYSNVTSAQAETMLNYLISDIEKDRVRIFPAFVPNENTSVRQQYLQLYELATPPQTTIQYIPVWKNSSCAFGGLAITAYSSGYLTPIATRRDNSDEPEPTDPYENPDPNEENPNIPIGESDIGGDGDWTPTHDPIPEPELPTVDMTGSGVATIYNPSSGELRSFSKYFWSPDILAVVRQFISSIDEVFIRLHIIPVKPSTEGSSHIYAGWLDSGVSASVVAYDTVDFDFGSISITRYFGSYLDYSPYTRFQLYLPYIGMVEINTDDFMPSQVNGTASGGAVKMGLKYKISVSSGAFAAVILRNSDVYAQYTGNCATEIPFTATSSAQLWHAIISTVSTAAIAQNAAGNMASNAEITSLENEASDIALSASPHATPIDYESMSKRGAAANLSAENRDIQRTSTQHQSLLRSTMDVISSKISYTKMGQIGANAGQVGLRRAALYITRPNLSHPQNYKHFEGYPLNATRQLSACHGFTQVEACNLSGVSASSSELREIEALLKQGIYI